MEEERSDMNKVNGPKRVKIVLLYAFMYLGGPLMWGAWMIFRLKLLSPGEYARCLLSPLTLAMLAGFLAGNLANVYRAAGARAQAGAADVLSILRAHCAALVAFGTVGTFVFLVPFSAQDSGARALNAGHWLSTAAIGALSGASFVFLVYGYFTVVIFRLITGSADILRSLRRFYSTLFPLGAVFFVTAAALAGRLQGLSPLGGASLAFPLATSGFLFVKTMSRINAVRGGVTHGVA
jgi:hypothetical protein